MGPSWAFSSPAFSAQVPGCRHRLQPEKRNPGTTRRIPSTRNSSKCSFIILARGVELFARRGYLHLGCLGAGCAAPSRSLPFAVPKPKFAKLFDCQAQIDERRASVKYFLLVLEQCYLDRQARTELCGGRKLERGRSEKFVSTVDVAGFDPDGRSR